MKEYKAYLHYDLMTYINRFLSDRVCVEKLHKIQNQAGYHGTLYAGDYKIYIFVIPLTQEQKLEELSKST